MELEFTEDQEELRDSVRTMLAGECPMSFVRQVVEDGASSEPLWKQMVELGWPALTVPEDDGGLGLGPVELAVVVEELGRVVAPDPVPRHHHPVPPRHRRARERGTARSLPRRSGARRVHRVTRARRARHRHRTVRAHRYRHRRPAMVSCSTASRTSSSKAPHVDELVVVARLAGSDADDAIAACVVPVADVHVEPIQAFDASRGLGRVTLDNVAVSADRVLGTPGSATALGVERVVHAAATSIAVESVGVCQTMFDITLDYAKQREQFGVPIGSFQALKHKFADLLVALEKARASAYFAALTIAEDDERRAIASSAAKVAAADCERMMSKEGIQLHGGIGYTWEHDMHLYVRRAKSDTMLIGNPGRAP